MYNFEWVEMQSSVKNFVLVFICKYFSSYQIPYDKCWSNKFKYAVATNVNGEIIKLYQINKK